MKPYSLDLRARVVRFVEAGQSRRSAASHFAVSVSFVVNLMSAYFRTGSFAPKPVGGWRYSKLDKHRDFLVQRVSEQPDVTMPELASELAGMGTHVHPSAISRWLRRNGYRYKKNPGGQRTRAPGRAKGPRLLDRKASAQDAA